MALETYGLRQGDRFEYGGGSFMLSAAKGERIYFEGDTGVTSLQVGDFLARIEDGTIRMLGDARQRLEECLRGTIGA